VLQLEDSLQYGLLGNTGLKVSTVGFGTARFSESFYDSSEQGMITLLRAAYDQGITFFDTADMYSHGRSESLLGKAFGPRQKDVIISSKVGYIVSPKSKLVSKAKALVVPVLKRLGVPRPQRPPSDGRANPMPQDFSPAAIRAGVEGSLRRLQRDYLDLYLLHGMPDDQGTVAAFATLIDLKTEGKIRHFGASCENLEDGYRALAVPGLEVIQVSLSLLEFGTLPLIREARKKSIGIVARQCFASGALARLEADGIGKDGPAVIEKYRTVAASHDRSLPELAFHYVNDCPLIDVTLIGVRLRKHLDDAIAFVGKPSLSAAEMADLAAVGAHRYD
jgi:aryl-alcohol dehydrogenase-like predicted oxidoreductase